MKKQILVLDYMQVRHEAFAKIFSEHVVTHCYSYADFFLLIRTRPYNVVCLDHDLDEVDDDMEKTGYDAAKELIAAYAHGAAAFPKVIVHSTNTVGAERIRALLADAGFDAKCVPFLF